MAPSGKQFELLKHLVATVPELDLTSSRAEAPDLVCPLTKRLMKEVALASDGFSYEWAAIEAHVARSRAGALSCIVWHPKPQSNSRQGSQLAQDRRSTRCCCRT